VVEAQQQGFEAAGRMGRRLWCIGNGIGAGGRSGFGASCCFGGRFKGRRAARAQNRGLKHDSALEGNSGARAGVLRREGERGLGRPVAL
jgi:hypothetical protein